LLTHERQPGIPPVPNFPRRSERDGDDSQKAIVYQVPAAKGTTGLTMPVDFMPEVPKLRRSIDDPVQTLEAK
jgi:hypothetical protein